jgi:uncharacterized protein YchJ
MNIDANTTSALLTVKKDLRARASAFWLDYVPYLANQTCPNNSCPTVKCPPILDQYISYLRLTVRQAQFVIIVFAATFGFFGLCCCILLLVYFRHRGRLVAHAVYSVKD